MLCPDGDTAVTPATVRVESWLAIAGGAHGLGFFPSWGSPAIGDAIAGVSRGVAELGVAMFAPQIPASSSNPWVKVSARVAGGAIYLVAVHPSYSAPPAT